MESTSAVRHGMKRKTIKAVLTKKIDQWLESIDDANVRKLAANGTIVTGGSISSMLLGEEVNDFDIYFKDQATTSAVANYYVSRFEQKNREGIKVPLFVSEEDGRIKIVAKSAGIMSEEGSVTPYQYFESRPDEEAGAYVASMIGTADDMEFVDTDEDTSIDVAPKSEQAKYRPVFLSSNAITLSDKIQIVLRFFGPPEEIHKNYDFIHCTSYWTSWDKHLELRAQALECLLSKELKYVGSKYPVCSVVRLRKFISRGWRINAGQILKMAMQISQLDLTDVAVLEDQLTGVDTAYFLQLIKSVKDQNPDKVDTAYVSEIIDRLFN